MMLFKRFKTYYFVFLATLFLSACNEKSNKSSIPSSPVNIYLDISIHYTHLNAPNENQCFTKEDINSTNPYPDARIFAVGYGGVLIHSIPSTNPNNLLGIEYSAFDMACPYEVDKNILVHPDESGAYAVCKECNSKFELTFGQIADKDSPAKENLKRYNAIRTGNNLRVTPRTNN